MKIFDSHIHIIDPRFPLTPNQGYLPDYFTCADYLEKVQSLDVVGGAIVSGSFQRYDQDYLIDSIQTLGDKFVGVTQLPYDASDEDILTLNDLGVKALRFNVNRGGSEAISLLDTFARRVYDLAEWHIELYINATQLPDIMPIIKKLPAVSIDHLGLSKQGFKHLLGLVDAGVTVKATGFGRLDFDPVEAMRQIYSINPDALMFGTDFPSTRAPRPFKLSDIDLIVNAFSEKEADNILYKNALKWYLKAAQ